MNVFPLLQRIGDRVEKGVEISFGVFDRYAERVGVGSDEFTFVHEIPPWTVAGKSRRNNFSGQATETGFRLVRRSKEKRRADLTRTLLLL